MIRSRTCAALGVGILAAAFAAGAAAQVPPAVAEQLRAIGRVVDPEGTARIYAPLQPKAPATGVRFIRDLKYGPGEKDSFDVAVPDRAAAAPRPVVLFVHGGAFVGGDKTLNARGEPSPFYDNIMLWTVGKDMVGVNMNYPVAPGATYPTVQQDIGAMVAWIRANIAQYGGDPNRIYLWGHSAGATHVASYVATPEHRGPGWSSVKGAILSSGTYELGTGANPQNHVYFGPAAGLPQRSPLPGLVSARLPLLVAAAELDPPGMVASAEKTREALCAAGRCPAGAILKDHSHMSISYHVNTPDESIARLVLPFIQANR